MKVKYSQTFDHSNIFGCFTTFKKNSLLKTDIALQYLDSITYSIRQIIFAWIFWKFFHDLFQVVHQPVQQHGGTLVHSDQLEVKKKYTCMN